jgi:hypothetical protein
MRRHCRRASLVSCKKADGFTSRRRRARNAPADVPRAGALSLRPQRRRGPASGRARSSTALRSRVRRSRAKWRAFGNGSASASPSRGAAWRVAGHDEGRGSSQFYSFWCLAFVVLPYPLEYGAEDLAHELKNASRGRGVEGRAHLKLLANGRTNRSDTLAGDTTTSRSGPSQSTPHAPPALRVGHCRAVPIFSCTPKNLRRIGTLPRRDRTDQRRAFDRRALVPLRRRHKKYSRNE